MGITTMVKEKFELEYLLKTSPKVLNNMLCTPAGLSDWFADNVIIEDDIYTFFWDGSEEQARLIALKSNSRIRWQWIEDEEEGLETYFEFRFDVDPMTKEVVLIVTGFATKEETQEVQALWDNQINELKRILGA